MSEIEKMYENAGLKKYDYMLCDNDFQCDGNCVNCEYQTTDNKLWYHSPFTAEKQIVEYCRDNEKYGDEYYTNPILKLLDIQEVE